VNLKDIQDRRKADAERFANLNHDLCMICGAYGPDKRRWIMDCFYAVEEVIPEAIDLYECEGELKGQGYYLRLCKTCRGTFLDALEKAANLRRTYRGISKGPDGNVGCSEDAIIPVRINGATMWMTEAQYAEYKQNE